MIVDSKVDYRNKKLVLIYDNGKIDTKPLINPYFYVIIPTLFTELFIKLVSGFEVEIEVDSKLPIIWNGNKYVTSFNHDVVKVFTETPNQVPRISSQILSFNKKFDTRISAHNVRYVVRNTFDNDVRFFNSIPLYYGFDEKIIERIKDIKMLLLDVEFISKGVKLCSCYTYSVFTDVNKDDVITLDLSTQVDELRKLVRNHAIISGYNLIGFDIPMLKKLGITVDNLSKTIFDVVYTLNTFAQSFWLGSSRSLLDVAISLKEKAKITDDEINIKRKSRKVLKSENINEITKYNINDIILTSKIMNVIFPFIATLSAYTQIPLSEITSLPSGLISEYFLLRFCELNGFVPEYTKLNMELIGERVYVETEEKEYKNVLHTDIKMMYPSFVYHNLIDPTLIVDKDNFSRKVGIGMVYSAIRRLYLLREYTKQLKKQDKTFEAMDLGVKAIINALTYGIQGKVTGYSIFGNQVVPMKVYYGTRDIQFKAVDYLKQQEIRVIYSDTDSFFIELNERNPNEIINMLNNFLRNYGLEVDVEDIYDKFYVYRKKNYICKKGDKVLIKGSALINLEKLYLPECISLIELLKIENKSERVKYIEDTVHTCEVHDLFIRSTQQIWRLVSKEIQSLKRMKEKISEYLRVLTVWNDKPVIYLKKLRPYQIYMPHTAPIIKLFIPDKAEIDLSNVNPHDIIELYSLKLDNVRIPSIEGNLLIFDETFYTVNVSNLYYILRVGNKEIEINADYLQKQTHIPIATLVKLRMNYLINEIEIDEDILRSVVLSYVKNTLREYNII